eukprot:CAMPEP_0185753984 /NCGR_PEP_ID=MMETSP1174-20130828/12652_1 /TAXON_ID=35687 /ORGANISM="Dictyocha speculum, Strain CCMP1381" /LENGTH=54 /DNA_ID=CAMNT_0028432023 /DNA_START=285 /DNA_END=450 /DNA_ORIENTATION=+
MGIGTCPSTGDNGNQTMLAVTIPEERMLLITASFQHPLHPAPSPYGKPLIGTQE